MPRLRLLAAAFVLLFAVPAFAQMTPPALTSDVKGAPAGVYVLDKNHASIVFRISHLGFSMYQGRFNSIDGKINLDPAAPEKSAVDIMVDINSVDTNNKKLESELVAPDWFNAAKFPAASFHATKITRTGPSTGVMDGDLTLMGVTKPLKLDVTFNGYGIFPMMKKPTLGFAATGTIKRSEWGFTQGIPMVSDDVQLQISAEFNYATTTPAAAAAPSPPPAAPAPAGK